jgi:glycosyltransferase involved in cell wall biosynthesis
MKVLVVNNAAPFIRGGAEELADHLVQRLGATPGVEAELLRLPFRWEPAERLIEEIFLHRQFRLLNVDRVVALKFPAYLVPHRNKTLWLLHQFRQAYDLYRPSQTHLGFDARGQELVQIIKNADENCFRECRRIYTNSPVTAERLKKFNGVRGEVLYPPINDPERFGGGDYGPYIFAGGRVGPGKRQHLLVEALAHTDNLKLVIAGPPEDAAYATALHSLVENHDLSGRVDLRFGFRPRDEIAQLVNGALACAYLPIDEDSLGYVTMESFAAGKAVITTTDAGGLLEIVHDHETGFVVEPHAAAVASAFARLTAKTARQFGQAAQSLLKRKNITWEHTINRLLG